MHRSESSNFPIFPPNDIKIIFHPSHILFSKRQTNDFHDIRGLWDGGSMFDESLEEDIDVIEELIPAAANEVPS